MKKLELIFIPAPGIGHLVSTLEFTVRLLDHDERLFITVLAIKAPFAAHLDSYANSILSSQPRITLIDLPHVDPPPPELLKSVEHFITAYIESHVPHVRGVVGEIVSSSSRSDSVASVVLDFFCESMISVAKEFGLPSYIYLTSNAGFLGLMLELPNHHERSQREFLKSSDPELLLPGFVNPVPVSVLPGALFDGEHGGYSAYIKLARGFRECDGILVNTFAELEPSDFSSLLRVYNIGPVLNLKGFPHPALDWIQWDDIWKWLDEQPSSSVVFLCFGSAGTFGEAQAREIAVALEQSGKSFLWSLRLSSDSEKGAKNNNPADSETRMILPEGFLERTRGRGVVCGWAPQVEVLAHPAIGGFVSHCGWNSIVESLWHGVPTATWPKYAEQQLNAFRMVKELGLAVELRLDYRDSAPEIVAADEIERAVRCLMDGEKEVAKKVKAMKDLARKAVMEGGSSFASIGRFIEDLSHDTLLDKD
ncbi:hypothetical protein CDL15_Pgr024933 [Punica granatum]|uniref:Glycosyltransferase n=1 Tax=Punica granatum TaxID=22663 RepID=A0A218W7Y0_PUNGR|nr:hypothetical protein CDL15_Pgr024933 [Punica granatum]PKI66448.1 hypothetical protein CRG98_013104 [Punica granatum]